MYKYSIILFLIILFFCNLLYSENNDFSKINDIKSKSYYIWGEGTAEKKSEAQQIAENDLLSKIQISINVAKSEMKAEKITQDGSTFVDNYHEKQKSYTGMYLKGLERLVFKKKNKYYVITYIHKDLLKESFDLRKEKIKSFVLSGQKALGKGKIGETLRNFYWGYLLALTYPDTINFSSTLHNKLPPNPQVALTSSLNTLLDGLEISAGLCYKSGDVIMIPLNFRYMDKKIKKLSFSYYSGMGTDYGAVEDGHAEIQLYDKPISRTRKLTLKIEYAYESEMSVDQEIMDIYEIFKENKFNNLKNMNISFPWIKAPSKQKTNEKIKFSTEAIDVLSKRKEISNFFNVLVQYKKLGVITFGNRSDFGNGKNCFVAVTDNKRVMEILYYNGSSFISLNNRETYLNLSEKFSGKRQIWIKEVTF